MPLISLSCLALVAIAAFLYWTLPARFRPFLLLAASYLFYCTWSVPMAVVLLAVTTLCYWTGLQIGGGASRWRSWLLFISVSGLIGELVFFKFRVAFADSASIVVPLGISYTTFRLVGYLVDVSWGKIEPERNWVNFATYVAFFPQLVAGPIERAGDFVPQIRNPIPITFSTVQLALMRILLGCFKKMAIADHLAQLVSYGLAHAGVGSALPSLLVFYLFPLQLYMDFSGLTDVAVGLAMLFGIRSAENFDAPFSAATVGDFWRRWHMSLTGWLRDYVFTALRMQMRNWGNTGLAISIFANMMLIALWHSFSLAFILFGVLHSIYLIVEALSATARKRYYKKHHAAAKVTDVIGPVVVYHLVALSFVFVISSSAPAAFRVLAGLFAGLQHIADAWLAALAAPNHHAWALLPFTIIAVVLDAMRRRGYFALLQSKPRWMQWSAYSWTMMLCCYFVLILLSNQGDASAFVYAKF